MADILTADRSRIGDINLDGLAEIKSVMAMQRKVASNIAGSNVMHDMSTRSSWTQLKRSRAAAMDEASPGGDVRG